MLRRSILLLTLTLFASACSVKGAGRFALRPAVVKNEVVAKRIAILPGDGPARVVNGEQWRKTLFEVTQDELLAHGLEVVDAATTQKAFEAEAVEFNRHIDNRNVYARLAKALSADLILVPELTLYSSSTDILNIGRFHYDAAVSFAIFSAQKSEFIGVVEGSGTRSYTTGVVLLSGVLVGTAIMVIGNQAERRSLESSFNVMKAGLVAGGAGVVGELVTDIALANRDGHWRLATTAAVRDGLAKFFALFEIKRLKPLEPDYEETGNLSDDRGNAQ